MADVDADRAEVARDWAAVTTLCAGSHRQSQTEGGLFINESPPESFYNLPFVLAYAILDQVLANLIDQGAISCHTKRPMLGEKMEASKSVIPWQNYALVDAGKTARNELAHKAKLLGKAACFEYIGAIEKELRAWGGL
jgi:hypothetical protein